MTAMLWILALHIITMVAWFAGLFYLPRLFVYHTDCKNEPTGCARFCIMEHKLFTYIMTPAALLTTIFGCWLIALNTSYYLTQTWMLVKLSLVILLWAYHLYCGKLVQDFKHHKNNHSSTFYRFFNEIPTVLLIAIVVLVVVKP